jgi:hypothetical protein
MQHVKRLGYILTGFRGAIDRRDFWIGVAGRLAPVPLLGLRAGAALALPAVRCTRRRDKGEGDPGLPAGGLEL